MPKKVDEYYVVRESKIGPTIFDIFKFDEDFNPVETSVYQVSLSNGMPAGCTCWQRKTFCRHKKILLAYQEAGKLGQEFFYNYTRETWHKPFGQ